MKTAFATLGMASCFLLKWSLVTCVQLVHIIWQHVSELCDSALWTSIQLDYSAIQAPNVSGLHGLASMAMQIMEPMLASLGRLTLVSKVRSICKAVDAVLQRHLAASTPQEWAGKPRAMMTWPWTSQGQAASAISQTQFVKHGNVSVLFVPGVIRKLRNWVIGQKARGLL